MKKVTSILSLFLLCFTAFSQNSNKIVQKREQIEIYFDRGSYVVDTMWKDNSENIQKLVKLIDDLKADSLITISQIQINSYTSPEGGRSYNKKLSERRSASVYDYFKRIIAVPDSLIVKNQSGTDWNGLETLVSQSDMQHKEEILSILHTVPEETWDRIRPTDRWLSLVDSRIKHLMELDYGRPYNYMNEVLFPKLRRGLVVTIYYKIILPPIKKNFEPKEEIDTAVVEPKPELEPKAEPIVLSNGGDVAPKLITKPLFALKTNLLYDALTALNVEVEVPIGNRWSVAGEWVFPWWSSCGKRKNGWQSSESNRRNTLELLNGNIEGKYWFGNRENRPAMTGWHVGLYAGGGLYDLERKANGYQGEFFIAAGVSGGYAHSILKKWVPSENLRMEYSLGVGYLQTNYRHYKEHWGIDNAWHTVRQASGTYSWFGPTRARVSLVWMLNRKVNKEK